MKVRFDQVDQVGEELARQSLETIAANVRTQSEPADSAILVFNPTSMQRTDVVDTVLDLPTGMDDFDLLDENGHMLSYQRRGLGSREIVNMELDTAGLQSAFGSITDGRVANLAIQAVKIMREGAQVEIEAIVLEDGEPNLAAWKAGRARIDEYLNDPTITHYHVVACSASATQIVFTAPSVPGLGYLTLWAHPRAGKKKPPQHLNPWVKFLLPLARLPFLQKLATRSRRTRPPYRIENEFFLIELEKTGTLALLDKRSGLRYTGLNAFFDGGDCGDEYNYAPPNVDELRSPRLKSVSLVKVRSNKPWK